MQKVKFSARFQKENAEKELMQCQRFLWLHGRQSFRLFVSGILKAETYMLIVKPACGSTSYEKLQGCNIILYTLLS